MLVKCSVCLANINLLGNGVSVTNCGHFFHTGCLNTWLNNCSNNRLQLSCPECRIRVVRGMYANNIYPNLAQETLSQLTEKNDSLQKELELMQHRNLFLEIENISLIHAQKNYNKFVLKNKINILVVDGGLTFNHSLYENVWTSMTSVPKSSGWARGLFEIENSCYIVGDKGIATLSHEFYPYLNNKEYDWSTTCQLENCILVICLEYETNTGIYNLFDPLTKKWINSIIKTKNFSKRNFEIVYYQKQLWLIGGTESKTIMVYDSETKTQYLSSVSLIQPRENFSVIVDDNKLFVLGGEYKNKPTNTVELFTPEEGKFVFKRPMKIARSDFGCCKEGKLIYVIGGDCGNTATNSVEIYDIETDTWSEGTHFPAVEYDLHACVVYNKSE